MNAADDEKQQTEAESELVPEQVAGSEPGSTDQGSVVLEPSGAAPRENNRSLLYWATAVLALLAVELYFYGSKGDIKVCVAKEGAHDFRLLGKERTDDNRWKFPFCEDRVNLGLRSHFDELGREAVKVACRRATLMHFKEEQSACNAGDKNWKRKIITSQIPPWDRRFYRRILWLDR